MWFFLIFDPYSTVQRPIFYERDEQFYAEVLAKTTRSHEASTHDGGFIPLTETDHVMKMFFDLTMAHSLITSRFSMPESIVTESGFKLLMMKPMEDVLFFAGYQDGRDGKLNYVPS